MKNLTLLIPAKFEKESLPQVLDEIKKLNCKKKVILAEDDLETINSIRNHEIEIIYQDNRGFGDALITGINALDTEYFCIFNADGSFDPKEISEMLNILKDPKIDFVFASRYQGNSSSEDDTLITLLGNKIFSTLGKILFRLPITDILYNFVVGKSDMAKRLNLQEKDFSFCVEFPIKAKKLGMKMISSNAHERKRIAGFKKVNAIKDGSMILIKMFSLFFSK
jgi:glycosyltransferase involved in cell wall biosynthesis